ncbi:MAG TPA: cytochrome c oxidase subunit 4 [Actinomycetota bacterium]|jgi:hypothetical protein
MRTAFRLLVGLGVFGLALGTVYWFLTSEVTGSVLLWSFGLMPLIVAAWIRRRLRAGGGSRPADRPDAVPSAAAGEVIGSFPAASAWPLFLALALVLAGAGLVYGAILLPLGIGLVAFAVLGMMRESRD